MIKNNINFSKITEAVLAENKIWSGKKETDPSVTSTLQKYWKNIGQDFTAKQLQSKSFQDDWPWSAAYVSYIMTRADGSFPKASAHRTYAESALKNRNESKPNSWKLYSLTREKQPILCQVGDVLVGSRAGSYTNSHGDIVWKVDVATNTAYLAGGNLSDTNSKNIQVKLNNDLTYGNVSKYLVVLKKMP